MIGPFGNIVSNEAKYPVFFLLMPGFYQELIRNARVLARMPRLYKG